MGRYATRWRETATWLAGIALGLVLGLGFAPAPAALAQEMGDDEGCERDERIYPEGYEMCQGSDRVRCENGAWSPIGMCEVGPTPPDAGMDGEDD